jgi:hypothetical protein
MNTQLRLSLTLAGSACACLMTIACGGDSGSKPEAQGSGGSSSTTSSTTAGTGGSNAAGGGSIGSGGGAAGSTAMSTVDCTKGSGMMLDTIADFEMGSADINAAPGRKGSFYTYNDMTAMGVEVPPMASTVTPVEIPGGRCTSKFSLHISAKGFTSWGAGFGSDIAYGLDGAAADAGTPRGSYDASAYTGIVFWARSEPGSKPGLRLNVPDQNSAPEGKKCVVDMTNMDPNRCYDDFGQTIGITTSWDLFKLPFAEMKQRAFGLKADAIDKAHLYGLQFQAPAGVDFDVWIDDIAFYK